MTRPFKNQFEGFTWDFGSTVGCTKLIRGQTAASGRTTPRPITAKVVDADELPGFIAKEGRVLHILHNRPHPGVPKLRATVEDAGSGRSFMVMDELGIDLNSYVRDRNGLPEDETRLLFRQLASAVSHCHRHKVVLRDIKLGKILFSDPQCTNLVLADLDGAEVMADSMPYLQDQKGSPAYVSPEVLCCSTYDGYGADMWSLGVVLYRMLTGRYPFHDSDPARLFDKIVKGASAIEFPATVSDGARALLRRLLDRNPRSRPTASGLLKEPWLQRDPGVPGVSMLRRRSSLGSLSDADEFGAMSPAESFVSKSPSAVEVDNGLVEEQVVPDLADPSEMQLLSNPASPVRRKYPRVGSPRKRPSTDWTTAEDEPERCTKQKTAVTATGLQGLALTF